MATKKTLFLK